MYKFEDKDHASVTNLTTKQSGINPGVFLWEDYQKWLAAGNTTEPFDNRTPEDILQAEKAAAWEQIKTERDKRMDGGFKVGTKWYHSDQKSRVQHLGLLMAGAAVPPVPWKTMDGTFTTMSPALAGSIFQAAMALDSGLFAAAEQHKAAMEASPDPSSYNFSTGWPENFLGL